jgi:hypothetical protein
MIDRMRLLTLVALTAAVSAAGKAAYAEAPPGYEVTASQTVANAPYGSVGRKTTDRETRVGNTPETDGNSLSFVMTIGGFARKCPTADGIVTGNFEYSLTADEVNTDDGETRRTHHAHSIVAKLEGHVRNDATLEYVEISADFIRAAGAAPEHVSTRFTPGPVGELDMEAMIHAVEITHDLSIAIAIWMATPIYKEAELQWRKLNECVELSFDPPSETRALGPNEAEQVRATLRTKDEFRAAVAEGILETNTIEAIGTVAPRRAETRADAPVTLTYTASARPRRGNGLDVLAKSRAGVANGLWKITERTRFEGTFTQTFNVAAGAQNTTTGNLVWTPEQDSQRSVPTFGDVSSTFYRASSGEITVDIHGTSPAIGGPGGCTYTSRKTFQLAELPAAARQYLVLEIAADGRYRLMLGMRDGFLLLDRETVCRVPGGRDFRQTDQDNSAAIQIGIQHGVLNAEQAVVGRLAQPIRRGLGTTDGQWSFTRVTQ